MTVVIVSASLALAGCQEGAEPVGSVPVATPTVVTGSGTGTASATSAPTGTATSTATGTVDPGALAVVPKAARAHTNAGAQAFAEFYLSQLNKAWSRPDPEAIRPYATSSCKTCANFVAVAADMQVKGQRYAGPAGMVNGGIPLPESTPELTQVELLTIQEKQQVVDSGGKVVRRLKRMPVVMDFSVLWRHESGWVIDAIRTLERLS